MHAHLAHVCVSIHTQTHMHTMPTHMEVVGKKEATFVMLK